MPVVTNPNNGLKILDKDESEFLIFELVNSHFDRIRDLSHPRFKKNEPQ